MKTGLGAIFVAAGPKRILKCHRGFWTVVGIVPTTASPVYRHGILATPVTTSIGRILCKGDRLSIASMTPGRAGK